jgi:hypothetical protein
VRDYFNANMVNRQRLLWAIATRRQLERWEPLVAANMRSEMGGPPFADSDIWTAEIEHHLTLIAAHHLLVALDLDPASDVPIDPTLRAELKEGRHLHEHWTENMPVFHTASPRRPPKPPRQSGKDFAARNPRHGPYWWLGWTNKTGPYLLPHAPSAELHRILDAVEAEVLAAKPELRRFLPPRAPSHWVQVDGEWWPTPLVGEGSGPGAS